MTKFGFNAEYLFTGVIELTQQEENDPRYFVCANKETAIRVWKQSAKHLIICMKKEIQTLSEMLEAL